MNRRRQRRSKLAAYARSDGTFDIEALSSKQKEELFRECQAITSVVGARLTPAQRRLHARARQRGRPRKGKGAQIVSLSIEQDLFRRAEELAKSQGLSRSELFSRGLRALLAVAGAA